MAKLNWIFTVGISSLMMACASQEVTFYVTQPPQIPFETIETIELATFEDEMQAPIALPSQPVELTEQEVQESKDKQLTPQVNQFVSNAKAADVLRSLTLEALAESGSYRLLDANASVNGVVNDPDKTAVLTAKVRYFEFTGQDAETMSFILIAKRENLQILQKAQLEVAVFGVVTGLEANGDGFDAPVPYVEKIAALETTLFLKRKSDGVDLVPPQTLTNYYLKKWGGTQGGLLQGSHSHAPKKLQTQILEHYGTEESAVDFLLSEIESTQLALEDPEQFLAEGRNLKDDNTVPETSLAVQYRLAQKIVDQYRKKIAPYNEEIILPVASGDAVAVNLMNGNAYEKAINRLENLPDRTEADLFNLALAYESVGERAQALRYYQDVLQLNPNNSDYQEAVKRNQIP